MPTSFTNIKAILFDLDHTLRASSPNWGTFFAQKAAKLGVNDSPENLHNAERWIYQYFATSQPADDRVRLEGDDNAWRHNLHLQYLLALGCTPERAKTIAPSMWKIMEEEYKPERILLPGVLETLTAFKENNFIMGVVTNRNQPVRDYLIECGLSHFFNFSLAAGEIGIWKPDRGIFDHALLLAGTEPQETLFIGDNYLADIVGAWNAGLHPVLLDPNNLFPEADCHKINLISDLIPMLVTDSISSR